MKILDFFLFCGSFLPSWIQIRNLYADPDPATQINADPDPDMDPDPKPCPQQDRFWGDFFSYFIQLCFICRPSDSIVPTDGIEPRTVAIATGALAVRRSNHWARSLRF
jgi:hypothetical protein